MLSMDMAHMFMYNVSKSHLSDTTVKERCCYFNPLCISSCNAGNMESPFPALEIQVNFQLDKGGMLST